MKFLTTLIILLNFSICFSQEFEGIVEYDMTVTPKTDQYTADFLKKEFGTKVVLYYKSGFYKEVTVGAKFMSFQLYKNDENKIYYKHQIEDDTLRFKNAIADKNENFDFEIEKNADTVLGKICNKLILKDNYGTKTYFYSSEYKLDPKDYEKYTYANKNELIKVMQAIYLKLIMEYQQFTVELIATKVNRKKLRKREFRIPKHKYIKQE
jgi:hypothetical protein